MFRLPDSWLWDFWLAEDDGTYHLFFLYASRALHDPDRRHLRAAVGHAISTDLVHWHQVQDALVHGDAGEFDQTATWTGSVIKGPDGEWFMFYTGTTQTPDGPLVQQVGLATSTDLIHWVKDDRNPLVQADSRWYETLGGPAPWTTSTGVTHSFSPTPTGTDGTCSSPHGRTPARTTTAASSDTPAPPTCATGTSSHPCPNRGPASGNSKFSRWRTSTAEHVLIFNCLPGDYSTARRAAGERGAIWAATGESALGPFDIKGATPLTDESFYVGKLVRDPSGTWVLLAFHNIDRNGEFGGALSDPMPVQWDGECLTVARTPTATIDSCAILPTSVPHGLDGGPRAGGQLQVEMHVGVVQLEPGQFPDSLQPVLQGAPVHGQSERRRVVIAAVFEVLGQGLDQLGMFGDVVVDQGAEPFADEAVDLGQIRNRRQHPEDAEFAVLTGTGAGDHRLLQPQGQLCLPQRTGQLRRPARWGHRRRSGTGRRPVR